MDLADIVGHLILSAVFITIGFATLFRKNAKIGIGGGRTGGNPLFRVEVNGIAATSFAVTTILGGSLIGLPFLLFLLGNKLPDDIQFWLPVAGIAIIFIGFFFSLTVQAAISAGEQMREDREKHNNVSKRD